MVYADVVIGKRGSSEELTYAVPAQIIPYIGVGSLVVVPVRDKKVKAIVVNLHKRVGQELKSKIREMLTIDKKVHKIPDSQLVVAKMLAKKYLTNTSDIIFRVLSSLRNVEVESERNNIGQVNYLQAVWRDRIKYYFEIISEHSEVLIIFPSNQHLEEFKKNIPIHYSHNIVTLTRGKSFKQVEKLEKILFIGTVGSSFLPIKSSGLIIIDQPSHIGSRYSNRPYLKSEDIALARCKHEGIDILVSQSIISPKQLLKVKNKEARLISIKPKKTEIIISSRSMSRSIFLETVIDKINISIKNKKKVCFFVASKGWSNGHYCRNCQELTKCSNCKRVTGVTPKNLSCSYCGQIDDLPKNCSNCGKNDYVSLGEGVDMVAKEVKNIFNPDNYQVVAGKHAKFIPEIKVAITTEKILIFPASQFDQIVIVSADRALTGGAIDDQWKFLLILKELSAMCNELIIQTYLPENIVWESIGGKSVKKYFEQELSERKKFNLPPFSIQLNIIGVSRVEKILDKQISVITEGLEKHTNVEFSVGEFIKENNGQLSVRIQIIFSHNKEYMLTNLSKLLMPNWAVLPT